MVPCQTHRVDDRVVVLEFTDNVLPLSKDALHLTFGAPVVGRSHAEVLKGVHNSLEAFHIRGGRMRGNVEIKQNGGK